MIVEDKKPHKSISIHNKEANSMGEFELSFPMYVCIKPDLSLSTRAGGLLE